MPVIDLTTREHTSECSLDKYTVKADAKDDEAYVFDLWLSHTLDSVQDADIAGKLIPGAREIYERATEKDNNEKFRQTVTPSIKGLRATITSKTKKVIEGGAEVLSVQIRASKKTVTVLVKLRMGGQTEGVASKLTKLLRNAASLSIEQSQQALDFPKATGPTPDEGDVVTFQAEDITVVGRVNGLPADNDGQYVVNNFGTEYTIDPGDVISFYGIEAKGKTMEELLTSFKSRCKRRDSIDGPDWAAISTALGEQFAAGPEHFNGKVHAVSIDTISRAVELLESGEVLPPEAGDDGAVGLA